MIDKITIDKFNSKIEKLESGCWEFTGSRHPNGYGLFSSKFERRAHRFSWLMHHGPIPKGLFVCHSCDNPPCVRIDHLWLGTAQQNMQDMARKNRRSIIKQKENDDMPVVISELINIVVRKVIEAKQINYRNRS